MKRPVQGLIIAILALLPSLAAAGGEGLEVPEAVGKKVPLEGLTGINLWASQLYNDNLWLFAVVCTVVMGVVGVTIAFGTDLILKAIGMEVHKIEHKE
ncbi:MAG: hypothetical protein HY905_17085 [Deltaproteobacteria bacterium]|nr:hypothetical protein [Deltaproteobacteria bacterium]